MFDKVHPPVGARPGTLAIPANSPPPRIRRYLYSPESLDEHPVEDLAELRAPLPEGTVQWIDIQGLGDESVLREIAEIFDIHLLALEDLVHVPGRPKAELYDGHLLVIARMLKHCEADFSEIDMEQIGFVLGTNFLLTFQEEEGDVFDPVRVRLRVEGSRMRARGADYLAYALLDVIIDAYYPWIERIGDTLEDLEDEVLRRTDPQILRTLNSARRALLVLRRSLAPQREAVGQLTREINPHLGDEARVFLRDVYDHCIHLAEAIDNSRELVAGLLNLYLTMLSNRTNDVMKVLTIVASIFVPLTFLAGIYGMNFEHMPELHTAWAYPMLLAVMVAVAIGMLIFFRRKGWLGGDGRDDED